MMHHTADGSDVDDEKSMKTLIELITIIFKTTDVNEDLASIVNFAKNLDPDILFLIKDSNERHIVTSDLESDKLADRLTSITMLVKMKGKIVLTLPIERQISILSIPSIHEADVDEHNNGFLESLRALINMGILPYFESMAPGAQRSDNSWGMARKRLNELSLSLQHLQQRIHVPDLLLSSHPKIRHLNGQINESLLKDTSFLNQLTAIVNNWTRQIQSITNLNHNPSDGDSIIEEVHFWKSMEAALMSLSLQIQHQDIKTTIEILNKSKRFHVTLSFENDTRLEDKAAFTSVCNSLLKDLPIDELLSMSVSDDQPIEKLEIAISNIFQHLRKLKNLSSYPLTRAIEVTEITLNDVTKKLVLIFTSYSLMAMDIDKFLQLHDTMIMKLFNLLEQNLKFMTNLFRELLRKRQEKFVVIKINQESFDILKARIDYIKVFRLKHQHLLYYLGNILSTIEQRQLIDSYTTHMAALNCLDLSKPGQIIWDTNEKLYFLTFHRLESSIISHMSQIFIFCYSFNDFVSVLNKLASYGKAIEEDSQYLMLLVNEETRLRILSAANLEIDKYIKCNTSADTATKQSFGFYYSKNAPHLRFQKRSICSEIAWEISLICKLEYYTTNLQKLLGTNWSKYSLGNEISNKVERKISSADPLIIYEKWLNDISQLILDDNIFKARGYVLKIVSLPTYDLKVNFDVNLIEQANEMSQLQVMGFKIPSNVHLQFKKIAKILPFVRSLKNHIKLLKKTFQFGLLETKYGHKIKCLLNNKIFKLIEILKCSMEIDWYRLSQDIEFEMVKASDLGEHSHGNHSMKGRNSISKMVAFQNEVSLFYFQSCKLSEFFTQFHEQLLPRLMACDYDHSEIEYHVNLIKSAANKLTFDPSINIEVLQIIIDEEVARLLIRKCHKQLLLLSQYFAPEVLEPPAKGQNFSNFILQIQFEGQHFIISPSLSSAKENLFKWVNLVLQMIETQSRMRGEKFNLANIASQHDKERLLSTILQTVLCKVDQLISQCEYFLDNWTLLQRLWELDLGSEGDLNELFPVSSAVGTWIDTLYKITNLRQVFDQPENFKKIGQSITIDFSKVYSRTIMKFDRFESEVAKKFGLLFGERHLIFSSNLKSTRKALELRLIVHDTSRKIIHDLHQLIEIRESIANWKKDMFNFKKGERLLFKLRFSFPSDWVYADQLEYILQDIIALVESKELKIFDSFESVSSTIRNAADDINRAISSLAESWIQSKPASEILSPSLAIGCLSEFQKSCIAIEKDKSAVLLVSNFLNIPLSIGGSVTEITEGVKELTGIWSSINTIWIGIDDLRQLKWPETSHKELRLKLDDLIFSSKNFNSEIKQYAAFKKSQEVMNTYLKCFPLIRELKSGSMKDRHWKQLLKYLGEEDKAYQTLTVGDVWALDLNLNKNIIISVVNKSRNEHAIEESLVDIKKDWDNTTFELFTFEQKFRLVKNWNHLFDQCTNNLNSLASMKSSVFHGDFINEINSLEVRLNKLHLLLEKWLNVQTQWIYLYGVFETQNTEIKRTLPVESSRFTNITYEFLSILKVIYKNDLVIDTLTIPDAFELMEKFLDSLKKIRKSLIEYLEKQRELFPRFYFIGNEDLLEIIGSSTDITRINKHFQKMFSGISSIEYSKKDSSIISITSEQGETLRLHSPISLIKFPYLINWLEELEKEVKYTLSKMTWDSIERFESLLNKDLTLGDLESFMVSIPAQVCTLVSQIVFTQSTEESINKKGFSSQLDVYNHFVGILKKGISSLTDMLTRKKFEILMIESLHQLRIINSLIDAETKQDIDFIWNSQQLFYYDTNSTDVNCISRLIIKQGGCVFLYGFEYIGIPEKLAYTPLLDKCFLSMSQAIDQGFGGSMFGPAGTGKTETIKAFGHSLGRMVLVFCCDEAFDFLSMGRIFLGICQVGCWGCFDEFNRLDENNLSAISSQIEAIKFGAMNQKEEVLISRKSISVKSETRIFITMNPDYAGRFELPDNLKKQFRNFSMKKPDSEVIVEILLTVQGLTYSCDLASIIVPFFQDIGYHASHQMHYDFGLRSLKNTLMKSGTKRRNCIIESNVYFEEKKIILQSIEETLAPKLVEDDKTVLKKLETKYFPGINLDNSNYNELVSGLKEFAAEFGIVVTEKWLEKAIQLYHIQMTHHGIMLVGASGSGKSTTWRAVLFALSKMCRIDAKSYIIDCKVMDKDDLYGHMDPHTHDWTDGLLTSIIRKIDRNPGGESKRITWIVFDGDIDPEWAENLNSCLDDNKLLTLPNGERILLPDNVRLVFETDGLNYATPATISRCGMVWFDLYLITIGDLIERNFNDLNSSPIDLLEESSNTDFEIISIQKLLTECLRRYLKLRLVLSLIERCKDYTHIMEFIPHRVVQSVFVLLKTYFRRYLLQVTAGIVAVEEANDYIARATLLSLLWAFFGDCPLQEREEAGSIIAQENEFAGLEGINISGHYIDYDISLPDCQWLDWNSQVQHIDLEPQQVLKSNTVIATLDTIRHENLMYSLLNVHKFFLLCGPPGSGKTMTLLEALRKSPQLDVLTLNFSKETSPISLMKLLEQYCEYKRSADGIILTPKVRGKWIVVFCDEINLPAIDKYGTQKVISLLRQFVEHGGFWNIKEQEWVKLHCVQFVGACNSPKDPGRHALTNRLLRHCTVIMVDYPGENSLRQIYSTFNSALLKCIPDMRGYCHGVTEAMIKVYLETKRKLTINICEHYVYSPRELTRWCKGILKAIKSYSPPQLIDLLRLWYYEGLRLFYDKLVGDSERKWTKDLFRDVLVRFFPNADVLSVMKEPIYYSDWLSSKYESIESNSLKLFLKERLRVFSDEELLVDTILCEDFLEHSLRIDRVLKQPQGHMILVGSPTWGKTTLVKFVAWINGLKAVQMNVHKNYGILDFDSTLKDILLKCATDERVCFIIDESNIIETSFIERMNTLLANAEIPGLFLGEEFNSLMTLCQEQSTTQGLLLDTNDELYDWFTQQISKNLHVVFTINKLKDKSLPRLISSPALFNRCVLDWLGDWSMNSLFTVGSKLLENVPLDVSNYKLPTLKNGLNNGIRDVIVDILIYFHCSQASSYKRHPGNFVSYVREFVKIFTEKLQELEIHQKHVISGLDKLRETVIQVEDLRCALSKKSEFLKLKDKEAKEMLNRMLTDQNEAERKQEFSVAAKAELAKQEGEIQKRRRKVLEKLALAEPAVIEAQRGVQNIKKQHLTEIRSMANPPAAVKMTMESVCVLLGYQVSSWRDVQLIVRGDDFIPNIVSFDNQKELSSDRKRYMDDTYLSRDDYSFEVVDRASKACGPLLNWVQAQLAYSDILDRVGPLRAEVEYIELQYKKTKAQLIAIDQMIIELEDGIESYKDNYSNLIRETENIKREMSQVQYKVDRSMTLVDNLTSERDRWKASIQKFGLQRDKLVGNSIIAAGCIIYAGPYDQKRRHTMMESLRDKLSVMGIAYERINVSEYLNQEEDDVQLSTLFSDDLDLENFVIIKRSRIPFLIDPSSKVIQGIMKAFYPRQLIVTSFLDNGYLKQLENALRFGGIIAIQDAEYYDPILNPILRNEVHYNGGRKVIKLGQIFIDISEEFKLILHTRDSLIVVPDFVSSRVSTINFSVTRGSLESQILNMTLRTLEPSLDEERKQLVLSQGKYRARLFQLEKQLLMSLGDSIGNILDNNSIIDNLESLKGESMEIDSKVSESNRIMTSIDEKRDNYVVLAEHSLKLFDIIERLSSMERLYHCSVETFLMIFENLMSSVSHDETMSNILRALYKQLYSEISPSLKYLDNMILAISFAACFYSIEIGDYFRGFFALILDAVHSGKVLNDIGEEFGKAISNDLEIISGNNSHVGVSDDKDSAVSILRDVIKCLSSDNKNRESTIISFFADFTSFLFSGIGAFSSRYDLEYWATQKNAANVPLLLASSQGFDATSRVELLSLRLEKKLYIFSMGSREGSEILHRELDRAITSKSWIIIQNVQMSPKWLDNLGKKLENVDSQSEFKMFLTTNLSSKLPTGIIRTSKVLIFENQPSLKTNLIDAHSLLYNELVHDSNVMRHLSLLLVWYHAVLKERLRYVPFSFSKNYDINDVDLTSAYRVLKKNMQNLKLGDIPWEEAGYLIGEIVYGSGIDNRVDLKYVSTLAKSLFKDESMNAFSVIDSQVVEEITSLHPPLDKSAEEQKLWILSLCDQMSLSYIGLEEDIGNLLRKKELEDVSGKVIGLLN
ncbi:uncharacterized protein PRCAT00001838001 [Priceomyces carsonii]|uniref:uncharacterized protein n=1 Tax=Priceomyces carsonii TaxID=28549 RepID=UPI002EDB12DA|nr:unnamed protein product [Priceomyces carsonii]